MSGQVKSSKNRSSPVMSGLFMSGKINILQILFTGFKMNLRMEFTLVFNLFSFLFLFFSVSHREAAPIIHLSLRKLFTAAKNSGEDTSPDTVSYFGDHGKHFGFFRRSKGLQAVSECPLCRQAGIIFQILFLFFYYISRHPFLLTQFLVRY